MQQSVPSLSIVAFVYLKKLVVHGWQLSSTVVVGAGPGKQLKYMYM